MNLFYVTDKEETVEVILTKICTGCQTEKKVIEFRKRSNSKDGFASCCKVCADVGSEKWRQLNLEKRKIQSTKLVYDTQLRFNEWKKEQGCSCCMENEPVCLDLHHLDPSKKDGHPSMFVKYGWNRLMKEATKCIVVCRNCHAKIHAGMIKL